MKAHFFSVLFLIIASTAVEAGFIAAGARAAFSGIKAIGKKVAGAISKKHAAKAASHAPPPSQPSGKPPKKRKRDYLDQDELESISYPRDQSVSGILDDEDSLFIVRDYEDDESELSVRDASDEEESEFTIRGADEDRDFDLFVRDHAEYLFHEDY